MKRIFPLFLMFFVFTLKSFNPVYADESTAIKIERRNFSKYLAPKAWESIRNSQGMIICTIPTFSSGVEASMSQGTIVDIQKGWIISVAHGISNYQDIALGKNTKYSFYFQKKIYPMILRSFNRDVDLALFEIKKFPPSGIHAISFAKKIRQFDEFYSFRRNIDESGDNADEMTINFELPWAANLVEIYSESDKEFLIFDRSVTTGFSGAGIFDKDGRFVGVLKSCYLPAGYSEANSANTVQKFIDIYKDNQEKDRVKKNKRPKNESSKRK